MIVTSVFRDIPSHKYTLAHALGAALAIGIGAQVFSVSAQVSSAQPDHATLSVLDGKSFTGELGGPGITPGRQDTVIFQDGMFLSKECQVRCGYTDGPYWVRSEGDAVQFRAETPCLKADASIVWTGTVKGDEIEGTFTWTSERWYWTVEKEFTFKGKLVESDLSATQ